MRVNRAHPDGRTRACAHTLGRKHTLEMSPVKGFQWHHLLGDYPTDWGTAGDDRDYSTVRMHASIFHIFHFHTARRCARLLLHAVAEFYEVSSGSKKVKSRRWILLTVMYSARWYNRIVRLKQIMSCIIYTVECISSFSYVLQDKNQWGNRKLELKSMKSL